MLEFAFVIETDKSPEAAAIALRKSVETAKWGILGGYDFSEILASKGFPQDGVIRVLDICAPGHANTLIAKNKLAALCMPCSVLIFTEGGRTKFGAMRPGVVMPNVFGELGPETEAYVQGIDTELKTILDGAA